ncbi:hypothetical protein NC653_009799 [Populus alba x Populus x berolinensis]|uniref:Uncharacterized protein n=1 Tax=Populus alba x Populus x berolinensis TaxID=444605 RepID=A0AAD6R9Y1_9ROSI|nr:hypothetical protein NC653_009799 [Populus alba x Populus x berolinensis]
MSRKGFWSKRATRRRKLAYAFVLSNVKLFLLNFKSSVFEESRDPCKVFYYIYLLRWVARIFCGDPSAWLGIILNSPFSAIKMML